jgi:hypothetical protein
MRARLDLLLVAVVTLLGGCASEDQFAVHLAPGFAAGAPVSVFGVFRDGRMTTKGWEDIAPKLDVLGLEPCGAVYDLDLVSNDGALASAVDDYARNYGVTDALLGAFGPAAQADLVLVVVISGALPKHSPSEGRVPPPSAGMTRAPRTSLSARAAPRVDPGALEISASLFSVRKRETVGVVSMRYTGRSEDEAVTNLDAKLKAVFPGLSCAGWDLASHPVDAEAVRAMREE